MQNIKEKYQMIYGYTPTDKELFFLYSQGQLWFLTDEQENMIKEYLEYKKIYQ